MTAHAFKGRGVSRALLAMGFLAVAVGVPFVVELTGSDDALRSAGVIAASGDTVSIADTVALVPGMPLMLDQGVLQSVGTTGVKQGETASVLRLERAAFRIPLDDPAPQTVLAKSLQPLLSHLVALNVGRLEIRNSRIDFVSRSGRPVAVTDISIDVTPNRKGVYSFHGTASFNDQGTSVDGAWSLPEGRMPGAPISHVGLRLAVKGSLLEAKIDGRMGIAEGFKFQGNSEIKVRRLRALARWFGLEVPMATNLRDASIAGPLEWADGRLVFSKAAVVVDGSQGAGALSLDTRTVRPVLDGTLAFKVFDLKPHLDALLKTGPDGNDKRIAGQANAETNGALVSAFDADLRLSALKVAMPRVESGRGAITITLKQGRLLAELAELEVEGGTASGRIALDVNGDVPRAGVKGRLDGVDPGRIFADDLKRNPMFGRANIVVDGNGTGHVLSEIISSFAGRGSFALVENGRLGLDLKALLYGARRANRVGWAAAGKGSSNLDQLDARFQLSNGALTLQALNGRSGDMTFVGGGRIDVRGHLFDLDVAMSNGTTEAPGTTRDVLVFRGPWSDPVISLLGRPFTGAAPAVKGAAVVGPIPVINGGRD